METKSFVGVNPNPNKTLSYGDRLRNKKDPNYDPEKDPDNLINKYVKWEEPNVRRFNDTHTPNNQINVHPVVFRNENKGLFSPLWKKNGGKKRKSKRTKRKTKRRKSKKKNLKIFK
jgi:hypothetical protein